MNRQPERIAFKESGPMEMARDFFFNRVKWRTRISRSQFEDYNSILSKNSEFYRGLSVDMKAKTMHRVLAFAADKEFIGHGLEITMKIKLTVAFAAVKLTFGFEQYLIPILHTIHISTSAFYTPMIKQYAKGLTSENGTMYLAWDSVLSGIEDEKDGLHLAVHEMAHALKIDTIKGSPAKERFAFYLNTWLREAEIRKTESDNSFIRAYGKTNMHEFFAVCMENFVERPVEFYRQEPVLFAHTCYLLNQFPLEPRQRVLTKTAVTSLGKRTGANFPKASSKDYTHHSWHWSLTLLLVSIFVSPGFIAALTLDAGLPIDGWAYYFTFCLIAAAVFYRPVVKFKAMEMQMYMAFVFLGGGPALYAGALVADAIIPIYSWEEAAKVESAYPDLFENRAWVEVDNELLTEWPETRQLPLRFMKQYKQNPNVTIHADFRIGMLGITRLRESWYEFGEIPAKQP
ncbi:MAG: zinc-dependent peptidase [Flavobacteriales bacterium]